MRIQYIFIALLFSGILSAQTFNNVTAITSINTAVGDSYPWISTDGLRLYYTSGEGSTVNSIYFTQRPNVSSDFIAPTVFEIGGVQAVVSIWLTSDEKDAYFTTFDSKLFYAHRDDISLGFTSSVEISLVGEDFSYFKGPTLSADQTKMILNSGTGKIFELVRTSPTTFAYVSTLNFLGLYTGPGQFSKDELSYFFSLGNPGQGIPSAIGRLTRTSTADSFNTASYEEVQGINGDGYLNLQPSLSANNEWLVFVRNGDGMWNGNDIYIAHNANLSVVGLQQKTILTVFPNPSDGIVNLTTENLQFSNCKIQLWDMFGKLIIQQPYTSQLDLSSYAKGMYLLKINGEGISETKKIVLK